MTVGRTNRGARPDGGAVRRLTDAVETPMQALEADFYVPRLVPVALDRRTAPSETAPGVQLIAGTVPGGSGRLTAVKLTFATPNRAELAGAAAAQAEAVTAEVEDAVDAAMAGTAEAEAVQRAEEAVTNIRAALPGAREGVQEAKAALARALASGEPPPPRTAVPDAERFLADTQQLLQQHLAELEHARAVFARGRVQAREPVVVARLDELSARRTALFELAKASALELGRELLGVVAAEAALAELAPQ